MPDMPDVPDVTDIDARLRRAYLAGREQFPTLSEWRLTRSDWEELYADLEAAPPGPAAQRRGAATQFA
jgi:hypothetical protein